MSEQYPGGYLTKSPVVPTITAAPGIWNLSQQAAYKAAGIWPIEKQPDAQFNYVTLLLRGDGTNGARNNTFLDSSATANTITRTGVVSQGSFSPYGSNWSNYFDGTGDYLTASGANLSMGTGDFTIEFWFFASAYSSSSDTSAMFDSRSGNDTSGFLIGPLASDTNKLHVAQNTSAIITASTTYPLNTWVHCAVVRSSGTITLYQNGVNVGSVANSTNNTATTNYIASGYWTPAGAGYMFNGYMSNFRIVKGTAVYTGAFTPPASPLTAVSGTVLLTCQSNRFVDNSSNGYAVTANNAPSVQRFGPFGTSTAYSTATSGGSAYFDGSNANYLSTPTTGQFTAAGNFTVSCWVYSQAASITNYQELVGNWTASSTSNWLLEIAPTTGYMTVYLNGSGTAIVTSAALPVNQWTYISLVRSGSTATIYFNGVSKGSVGFSGTFGSATKSVFCGDYPSSPYPFTGYITDVRLLDGVVDTTVPTAPLTAVSGTGLLLNMTNAAIYDNAMVNDLRTVGNAQISTSVKKYGTGSLLFNGSPDYLTAPSSQNFAFGTGNFTIEAWIYPTSTTSYRTIFTSRGTLATSVYFGLDDGSLYPVLYTNTTVLVSSTAVSLNAWSHVALVRNNGTATIYVNGVSGGSASNTTDYTQTQCSIGYSPSQGLFPWYGYIDDLRITKGYARYTTTFTPPTAALPNTGPT